MWTIVQYEVVLHALSRSIVLCIPSPPVLPSHTFLPPQMILGDCAVSLDASTLTTQSIYDSCNAHMSSLQLTVLHPANSVLSNELCPVVHILEV